MYIGQRNILCLLVGLLTRPMSCQSLTWGMITPASDHEAMEEFCSLQTFRPQCWKNEVIVVEEALYGRRRTGKCISAEQASKLHGPEYFGCYANVLHIVSRKCSGRKECEVSVPDSDLEQTMPCLEGLKMFLEVRYSCVAVVEPDRSCVVSVTSSPLHIAAAAAGVDSWSTQSNIGCGTKTQPWMVEAPAGQRINISLLDFTAAARLTSQHLTRSTSHVITSSSSSSSSSGSCVDEKHQYGYIIDKSSMNKKNVSVCHARSNRQTHVYLSTSNTLQLVLINDQTVNFLLKTAASYELFDNVEKARSINVLKTHSVAAAVAVGFAGLAVCLTIICCGVVYLRRYYALFSRNYQLEADKSKYNQLHHDDVRRSTDAQLRWTTTSQPAFGAEPQYCLYAADSNDV